MKRFLAIALLVTASAQGNELKKAWDSFGKHDRLVSTGKATIVGVLGYFALRTMADNGLVALALLRDDTLGWTDQVRIHKYSEKTVPVWEAIARTSVTAGGMAFAAKGLLWHQFFKDAKHAANVKDGWFS